MMYRGVRAARKTLWFVHVCTYIDAGRPVRSAHGIHKPVLSLTGGQTGHATDSCQLSDGGVSGH